MLARERGWEWRVRHWCLIACLSGEAMRLVQDGMGLDTQGWVIADGGDIWWGPNIFLLCHFVIFN